MIETLQTLMRDYGAELGMAIWTHMLFVLAAVVCGFAAGLLGGCSVLLRAVFGFRFSWTTPAAYAAYGLVLFLAGMGFVSAGRKARQAAGLEESAAVTQKIRAIKANDESILIPTPIISVGTKICTDRFFIYSKKILLSPADCPDSVSVIAQLFPVSSPQYSRYCRASS